MINCSSDLRCQRANCARETESRGERSSEPWKDRRLYGYGRCAMQPLKVMANNNAKEHSDIWNRVGFMTRLRLAAILVPPLKTLGSLFWQAMQP